MQDYIGTKQIKARPMNHADYNVYRGWKLPSDENGADEGYLVEYCDGGQSNHPDHEGYISWSPKEQFDNAYRVSGEMPFGHAHFAAMKSARIWREGWNGKGLYVTRTPAGELGEIMVIVDMHGRPRTWVPSMSDQMANDWHVSFEPYEEVCDSAE